MDLTHALKAWDESDNAEKLRLLMSNKKTSQVKIAKRLGITEKTLSQKMHGKADFKWREVLIICSLLDIDNPKDYFPK